MPIATPSQADTARAISVAVNDLFHRLVRERLHAVLLAEINPIIDSVLGDLPVEVTAMLSRNYFEPFGHHITTDVKVGRL